jgi:hypothetical protein
VTVLTEPPEVVTGKVTDDERTVRARKVPPVTSDP